MSRGLIIRAPSRASGITVDGMQRYHHMSNVGEGNRDAVEDQKENVSTRVDFPL